MFRRKFIRLGSALLMILALTLPVFTPSALALHTAGAPVPGTGGTAGFTLVTITGTNFQTGGAVNEITAVCFGTVAEGVDAALLNVGPAAACPGATAATAVTTSSVSRSPPSR